MELGTSVHELRAFLPAKDFAISKEFYGALEFEEAWSSEQLVLLTLGRFSFFLQNYFVKEWAENMVMSLDVADVEACFANLQRLNVSTRFPNVRLGAPQPDVASGVRRGHFIDPSGVLWHFCQSLS